MFNSTRIALNRSCREIVRDLKRQITKTSSVPNSDAISRQQENKFMEEEARRNQWKIINRHNNIRALSTIQAKIPPKPATIGSKDDSREFMAVFPDIVRDLTDAGRHTDIPTVTKHFAKVLQHNVPNGKKVRGLTTVFAYKLLEKPENLTPENIRLANILGWCVEMLQGFLLIVDDMIDGAETRRGSTTWYKNPEIGLSAINDSLMVENGVYALLKRYFQKHPCYVPLLELFHDVTLKAAMGQGLDNMVMLDNRPNFGMFKMDTYNALCRYKTGYYSMHLPVAAAMYLADYYDPEQHRQAKTILLEIGTFLQIQDDFLDVFGDPEVTGKTGNDIREGKLSWLSVLALQRANGAQRELMEQHYGVNDPASISIIKSLYEELSIPSTYATYEEESFNMIRTHIQQISKGLPHNLFFRIMEKIYRREN